MRRSVVASAVFALASCHPPHSPRPAPAPETPHSGTGAPATAPVEIEASLDKLKEGASVRGFTVVAVYLDDTDHPIGARFVHDATHFTFDYLRIESAPQGFLWVQTYPTSDQGEPHTQEHLLLGKGARGRKLGSSEAMALATSSAFTAQWRTAYHYNTVAGNDAIWSVFANQLDATLNPDYTDEEIRREVRNFGVDKGDDGKLHLEEKGTVYNEMVRAYEAPDSVIWREAGLMVYGPKHPLALESGGLPSAIRTMTPKDIRTFHDSAYHLANMGVIGAFPSAMSLGSVLDHTSQILAQEAGRKGKVLSEADLPKPAPAAAGTVKVFEYPYGDTTNPGPMMFAWPASHHLDVTERVLASLFFDAFAGDESTPIYKKLIDSKTRVLDTGATGLYTQVSTDLGNPIYLALSGVKADKLDDKTIEAVRALVLAELERVAKLPDGDPELVAFDERVKSRIVDLRRRYAKLLDSPPGFGTRGEGTSWIDLLTVLAKEPGFDKSLTLRPELAKIDAIISTKANPWRERIRAWGLLDKPFGLAARPSPELRARLDSERKQRIEGELDQLAKHYGTKDAQATLAAYAKDYDVETAKLEASAKATPLPELVPTAPMTLDDGLQYKTGEINGLRSLTATFESMTSARVQLAFDVLSAISPDDQYWLAALPDLMSDSGVIEDGKAISAEEVRERQRREVLELSVYFTHNLRTHRVELVVAGAGNGATESKAALAWMRRVMLAPDWRVENLPRLRDLVDQRLTELRQRMLGAEEGWVEDPRDAWAQQRSLEYLHTGSFLTQAHDLHRIKWMLADPGDAKASAAAQAFITQLADASKLPRADLIEVGKAISHGEDAAKAPKAARWLSAMKALPEKARPLAAEAGKDLALLVPELPNGSLAADWKYLCKQMAHDLKLGAPAALGKLAEVRAAVVTAARARVVEVGSTANQTAIAADVDALATAVPRPKQGKGFGYGGTTPPLEARLLERGEGNKHPLFVGLVDPSTSSGVIVNLAKAPSYSDTTDDALMDVLASDLYTGHGAHSLFMKTWAAGLAYSNGVHPRISQGSIDYYAERCPLLPQTIRFVVDELKKAQPDPNLARYALATAFHSRVADRFEARANAMAADLVDGQTPDLVRQFRTHLVELAKRPDFTQQLFARMNKVYAKVIPGLGALDPDATYFVIGPEKQLGAYEDYLHGAVSKDTKLHRIYPRDFWIPAKL